MGEDIAISAENDEIPTNKRWINKNLILLKITLFFLYGATSSLVPFLPNHMQSIGLTTEEMASIYLALPLTTFLAPPLTGFLIDKFGQYKPFVIASFLLTAALHHSLLLIPPQETPGITPSGYVIYHPHKHYIDVWWSPCSSRECPDQEDLDIVLDMCEDHCLLKNAKKMKQNSKNMSINSKVMEDPGNTDDLIFHIGNQKNKTSTRNITAELTLEMHENLGEPIEQLGIEMESAEDSDDVMDIKKRFSKRVLRQYGVNITDLEKRDLRCGGVVQRANSSTIERFKSYSNDCILQKCQFRSGGPEVCPPDYKESDDKTFWIYFFLRFIGTVMLSAGVTIMDPIALAMIEQHGGDFGKERLFSTLGMAISSPVTGVLIDLSSEGLGYTNYAAAFYTFDILLIVSSIAVFMMPPIKRLPADNIFRDILHIFKMPPIVIFIFFLFILGNLWGFIEMYLFFYLRSLGAPSVLLGITVTVGAISSLPFMYGAENITKKLGHVNVIIIAFFAHAIRLVGYSVIESAWWCFPFEAMESLSVHLMWVAAATYCASLAPKSLLATLIGVCGMAHFSIGRGSGSFFGGNIIAKYGIRQSFRIFGLVAVISGCAYAILHYLWLRKISFNDDKEDDDNEESNKLNEPKTKDVGTMVSFERLSLVVEYNQIGSLTSLGRYPVFRTRSNSIRRRGSSGSIINKSGKNSQSKIDLLKSALEVNHARTSNPQIKNSNGLLNYQNANGSGKIYSETSSSASKLALRSASLITSERNFIIPNENDEIVYVEARLKRNENDQDSKHGNN